ncbi:hypothetical protein [Roseomonas rosulenta]|uniref:hypothetical protein n=1 Tax=Roseomonas rosulenta TaxID=2748667 RepID=UPI0018DFB631|nr:hypothetical protein [Roseomonas rosulenta]
MLSLLVVTGILAGPAAHAQNEPVRFVNRAAQPATALHVTRTGNSAWSANLLNRGPLPAGQFLAVRLGEGAGCRLDIRLVLQDGTEIQRQNADVCTTRSVELAPAAATGDQPPPAAAPQPRS